MNRKQRRALALLAPSLAALSAFYSSEARAFCRTTTCDPATECEYDSAGCATVGEPLSWHTGCVSFSVQRDGSEKRDISFDQLHNIASGAFDKWLSVECADGLPSLDADNRSPVRCARPEYNSGDHNANVIMFRDSDWPYAGAYATLALTTITFNFDTGEIFDADIEINSANTEISTGNSSVQFDLDSILTHEIGHFLGLSHSNVRSATMYHEYKEGDTALRDLAADDEDGICATYPSDRDISGDSCEPRHGFSGECDRQSKGGCRVDPANLGSATHTGWLALGLLGLGGLAWARRRSSRA